MAGSRSSFPSISSAARKDLLASIPTLVDFCASDMKFHFPDFLATPRTPEPRQGSNIMAWPDALAYVLARILGFWTLETDPTRHCLLHSPTSASEQNRAPTNFFPMQYQPLLSTMPTPFVSSSETKRFRKSRSDLPPKSLYNPGTRAHLWLTVHHHVNCRTQSALHLRTQGFGRKTRVNLCRSVISTDSNPSKRMRGSPPKWAEGRRCERKKKGHLLPTQALRGGLLQAYTSSQGDCAGEESTIWSPRGMIMVIKFVERLYTPESTFQYCTRHFEEPLEIKTPVPAANNYAFELAFTRFHETVVGSR